MVKGLNVPTNIPVFISKSLAAKLHKKSKVHKFVVYKSQGKLKDKPTTIMIAGVEPELATEVLDMPSGER